MALEGMRGAIEAQEEPGGPRRDLSHELGALGVGTLGRLEQALPLRRIEIVLQQRERHGAPAVEREALHPRELGLFGREIRGHLEDAAAGLGHAATDPDDLVLGGERSGDRLAVDGPVQHRA